MGSVIQGIAAFVWILSLTGTVIGGQYAVTNATIVTVSQETIQNGTLVIVGDRIKAVGTDVVVPRGVKIVDAAGLFVYPGMIGPDTNLGLTELGGVTKTQDQVETGTYNTFIRASQGVNPHTILKGVARWNGVTSVITSPRAGENGVFAGHEVLLNLDGWSVDEMSVRDPVALQMTFPGFTRIEPANNGGPQQNPPRKKGNQRERAEKILSDVRELFEKTKLYVQAQKEYASNARQEHPVTDLTLEGPIPVVRREAPVTITVNGVENIREAISFVRETGIPVLYSELLARTDQNIPYDLYLTIPSVLHNAGVTFAFTVSNASSVQNLPFMAGMAAAYGLPKDIALKAVTLYPAEIYGVEDELGSLEAGKMANVVITDGDLLEPRTKVIHEFIRGVKVDLSDNYQYLLYEKYRKRPAKK